jgi:uncharacterized protein (DUF924 family)
MMDHTTGASEALRKEILAFRNARRTAVLGTVGAAGRPLASYAPCVGDDAGHFYVFVSGLSRHTRNLVETGQASLLLLDDEDTDRNTFERRRLAYDCNVVPLPRDAPQWDRILDRFGALFGDVVQTLRELGDFQLFRLTPQSGTYVRGFGQAFAVADDALTEVQHIGPRAGRPAPLTPVNSAAEVLSFWYSERIRPQWFRSTPELDQEIREHFLATYRAAAGGTLDHWKQTPSGALALVIALDQFPPHIFRGRLEALATAAQARGVAVEAIANGFDRELTGEQKAFLYMPLMHSEDLADQDRAVDLFEGAGLDDHLKWARHHRELIRRFGRFPHRNAIVGRESTPEEIAYLRSEEAFRG